MERIIYSVRELDEASEAMLKDIDKAVLAAAYKVRNDARSEYIKSKSIYKYSTDNYDKLQGGIMVGRLTNGTIKLHALGNNKDPELWKVRFLVGGTKYRDKNGANRGLIQKNDALLTAVQNNKNILNQYINNAINK